MHFRLTGALNDLFIEELRRFWGYHPKYADLVDNIQGKYSFDQRPQRGIVVKISGGSNVRLQADNFQTTKVSYVFRAKIENHPGVSIEWVREDHRAIQENGGTFPSLPGAYHIDIVESDLDEDKIPTGRHKFTVTPLLENLDEAITLDVGRSTGFVQRPFIEGTLRLIELPSNFPLQEGTHYTADSETGEINLTNPLPTGLYLSADYRYDGVVTGPFDIQPDRAHYTAIPGAILAFGRRITPADRVAIMVTEIREAVALEYGGRWDLSVDIEYWARDIDDQREMSDLMMTWIPSILRDRIASHGVEIGNTSFGGETEEPYDDNAEDFFYGGSLSLEVQTDWALHVPLSARIRQILPMSPEELAEVALLSTEELAQIKNNLRLVRSFGLRSFEDPFFTNLFRKFEVVR
jgi:hypothetical protein